ncbi:MAG: class I SAM-dependent methyltransferase [Actinomycetota bacterium]|nr:class I SAM-dependent methyltransferase [Actinomycetota bacterium]
MTAEKRVAPAADYDQFVNWEKRLAREAPLFRTQFHEVGAERVLDVGAGSARHSLMFATWGLEVLAVDPSESMLSQARENVAAAAGEVAAAGGSVALVSAGFGELASLDAGLFDALICTGNALPHVGGTEKLHDALADFAAVLRPGAVLILHLLNHARLLESKPRSIPPVVRETEGGTKLFLRVMDYPEGADHMDFDFLTLVRDSSGDWDLTHRSSSHTLLPPDVLVPALERAGFERIELLGAHDGTPLDASADESVIVVARRS